MSDAKTLLEITAADYALLKLKKRLDELPQRARLLEIRTKRAELDVRATQVAQMRTSCDQALKLLQDEETMLQERTREVQAQIDKTNNYKEITAFTSELESFARRMEKLEFDELKQLERSDKINQVIEQLSAALEKLAAQDEELLTSYQTQAGAIQKEAALTQHLREKLAADLLPDLLKRYEKARASKGGQGAAHIEGSHCSACSVELTDGQLGKLRSGGEIGECPHCHRLLVVNA
jgi:predicted  nucleic acid-binding Zn-ribbon protein